MPLTLLIARSRFHCSHRRALCAGLALVLAAAFAPALVYAQRGEVAPEAATGRTEKALVTAGRHMVVAANPYAASAGLDILRAGGSAADAAVATALVLGLVEPQSSGLGGGGFALHWQAGGHGIDAYDGRETAPAAARPDRFLDGQHRPIPFDVAVHSGRSVGVPGFIRLIELLHREHGRLAWARLFEPAIRLASDGFLVSRRLSLLLEAYGPDRFALEARAYFFDAMGRARPPGTLLKNPVYAVSLQAIANDGAAAFYEGAIAQSIVKAVTAAAGGDMSFADLARYRAMPRAAQCTAYRDARVCGPPPPSSGGLTIGATLALIEPLLRGGAHDSLLSGADMHMIAEAEKLAFADRDRYIADPAFAVAPEGLLDTAYLAGRRQLIDPGHAMARPEAGMPLHQSRAAFGLDATIENAGTSHLSIVDADGNAVAMTASIEAGFGSRLWAAGFLLNNELTDFSFLPEDASGRPIANRVEAEKRPRSSMAPMIVLDETAAHLKAVLGSPGGARILLYNVKALVGLLDWGLDAPAAASLPNFGSRGDGFELEPDARLFWGALALKGLGHKLQFDAMTSGLHIIVVRDGHLEGGADPRREGVAVGD